MWCLNVGRGLLRDYATSNFAKVGLKLCLGDVLEDVDGCVGGVLGPGVRVQLEARHRVHPLAVDEGGGAHVHRHRGHGGVWGRP